ncbi:unnamed protein product [Rotaria socialis]|uniref:Peptidase C1A papain C-terminal domain-containing protein n=1 Tax=Rotaria socialis TaxID=392032 RepID=A0A818RU33_9BILA|nr:unnamed protein product [Rotaria socialis]CAF3441621.1 unnamed protein product [Rotaria socialis]CAF3663230.1 unnamed protein product [Rotaria socialis]CAF3724007.1 unnamed protein product [Rotaria socialis]CAF4280599.1 unnamed protein product [Rotaria socialis]
MPLKAFLINKLDQTRFRLNGVVPSSRLPNKRQLCQTFRDHILYRAEQLPPKIDLRTDMTAVEDQSQIGSCTANSLAGAYEYLTKKANGRDIDVSRLFIYYNARVKDQRSEKVIDSGCTMTSAIEALEEFGTCLESIWPYDISNVNVQPNDQAYRESISHKITEALRINIDLHEMKSCLAQGFPFAFGLILYASFDNARTTGVVPMPNQSESSQQSYGSHALLAVGYSDQSQAFIVRNSWGENWGDNGYCYIPYDYLTNSNLCFDVWTIRKIATDNFSRDHWDNRDTINYVGINRNHNFNDHNRIIESIEEGDDDDDDDVDDDSNQSYNSYQNYRGYREQRKQRDDFYQEPFTGYSGRDNFSYSFYDQYQRDDPFGFRGDYSNFDSSRNTTPNFFSNPFIPSPAFPAYQQYGQSYGYTNPYTYDYNSNF